LGQLFEGRRRGDGDGSDTNEVRPKVSPLVENSIRFSACGTMAGGAGVRAIKMCVSRFPFFSHYFLAYLIR
jgi:hypothetical protein